MKLGREPLSATLDGLALRWIMWRDIELLRGVAFVVRDANWATLVPDVAVAEHSADGARLRATLPQLTVDLHIETTADRITISSVATAAADFITNRTGFVVLHGEACAGLSTSVEHGDGSFSQGSFPDLISPHQPFVNIAAITHEARPGLSVRVTLFGETFEMEDHRNWSDAGFKTYGRPLALPRPFVIRRGESVSQRVQVDVSGEPCAALVTPTLSGATGRRPRLVRGAPAGSWTSRPHDAAMLVAETQTGRDLEAVRRLADGLPVAALLAGEGDRVDEIAAVAGAGPWAALLIAHPTEAGLAAARRRLPGVPIGGGSDQHFAEFNRRPPPPGVDIVFWGVSATVHAVDDASVLETLRVLADQARTARARSPGAALWVGPIGIGARWQADARDAGGVGTTFLAGHLAAWGAAGVDTIILPA